MGVVQPDDLTVDREATARALVSWQRNYPARVQSEAARLSKGVDLVLGDVPPLAFAAAARARVPAVALANFSWDWIYDRLGCGDAARAAAEAYDHARLLLELDPACPMPAFRHRLPIGVVGRRPTGDREELRQRIGVRPEQRLVLVAFRGANQGFLRLPQTRSGICYLCTRDPIVRADVIRAPAGTAFTDLLVAADAVVAKPGYGIIGDAAVCGTPMLYIMRSGFPEDATLAAWIDTNLVATRVSAESLRTGAWQQPLDALLTRPRSKPTSGEGLLVACDAIREILG